MCVLFLFLPFFFLLFWFGFKFDRHSGDGFWLSLFLTGNSHNNFSCSRLHGLFRGWLCCCVVLSDICVYYKFVTCHIIELLPLSYVLARSTDAHFGQLLIHFPLIVSKFANLTQRIKGKMYEIIIRQRVVLLFYTFFLLANCQSKQLNWLLQRLAKININPSKINKMKSGSHNWGNKLQLWLLLVVRWAKCFTV